MYGVGFNFGWQEHRRQRLRHPLHQPARQHRLRQRVRQHDQRRLSEQGLRRPDGRRRRAARRRASSTTRNMFVTGCSGGGVLTAWTVGHTDRFAAASANCPVIDWLSFVGTTDGASWYYNFEKLPWEDPSEHFRRSPLTYVGNVKTPTMLMTGVQRSAHADAADRAVLQRAEAAQGADRDGPLQRRVARHDEHAVELHAHAAVSALLVRQVQAAAAATTTTARSSSNGRRRPAGRDTAPRSITNMKASLRRPCLALRSRPLSLQVVSRSPFDLAVTDLGASSRKRSKQTLAGDGARAGGCPTSTARARPARRQYQAASEWAMKKFTEWGLKNVHQERFPFGQGWTIERFSAHLLDAAAAAAHRLAAHGTRRRPTGAVSCGRRARRHPQRSGPGEVQGPAARQDRDPASRRAACACSRIASCCG